MNIEHINKGVKVLNHNSVVQKEVMFSLIENKKSR